MTDPTLHPLEMILRQCAVMAPEPWYPSLFARSAGIPRDSLDPHLDQLRLGGLIRLTDWVQGTGQGYALTPEGQRLLENPRALALLRDGKLVVRSGGEEERAPAANPITNVWERGESVREALLYPAEGEVARALIFVNVMLFMVGLVLAHARDVSVNTWLVGGIDLFSLGQEKKRLGPAEAAEQARLNEVLLSTGAVWGEPLLRGEWWRLLSNAFVHFGLIHLGMNSFALFVLGRLTEPMWGRLRFLVLFMLAALGGSCAQLLYQPYSLLAGASGGACGVLASAGVWILLNRQHLPEPLVRTFLRNLAINIVLITLISMMPNVGWAAHLGGGVVGAVAAVLLNHHRFGSPLQRLYAVAGMLALAGGSVGMLAWATANDPRWQQFRPVDRAGMVVPRMEGLLGPEARPLRERVLLPARTAIEEAETVYREVVWPLLRQEPGERDPERVRTALAAVRDQGTRLRDVAASLKEEAAALGVAQFEQVGLARADDLRLRALVFDLLAGRLEKGAQWTQADAAALTLLRTRVSEDDRKWQLLERQEPAEQAPP